MADPNDNEAIMRLTVKELIVFILFLTIVSTMLFCACGRNNRMMTRSIQSLFLDKSDDAEDGISAITNIDGFWNFLENQMLDNLFPENWYNVDLNCNCNNYSCPMEPGINQTEGPCPLEEEDRNLLYENKLIGVPRLRQLRVENDTCVIPEELKGLISDCYSEYHQTFENKSTFTPRFRKLTNSPAWRHNFAEDLGTSQLTFSGKFGVYSGNGAIQDLTRYQNTSLDILSELKETLWISRSTRVVFVDFTVYNGNINLFCVVTLMFEFPATGGIIATGLFDTLELARYVTPLNFFALGCYVIHLMFIIYYIVEEIIEMFMHKFTYFRSLWNLYDCVVIGANILTVVFNVYDQYFVFDTLPGMLEKTNEYSDFKDMAHQAHLFRKCLGITLFLSWMKVFKFINFNRAMNALISTLSVGINDLVGFMVMFMIVFSSFAQLGHFMFGKDLEEYRNFLSSVGILYRTLLGDFDYYALREAQPVWGRYFFFAFIFFNLFILISMLLAIINDTYILVKSLLLQEKEKLEMIDYLIRGYNNILDKGGMRRKSLDADIAVKLAHEDEERATENVRDVLRKCNFSNIEIEMFYNTHGFDETGFHGFTEQQEQELEDAEKEGRSVYETSQYSRPTSSRPTTSRPVSGRQAKRMARSAIRGQVAEGDPDFEEFMGLEKRVSKMETVVSSIDTKLTEMLGELESMERTKSRRKEHMEKILEGFTKNPEKDLGAIYEE